MKKSFPIVTTHLPEKTAGPSPEILFSPQSINIEHVESLFNLIGTEDVACNFLDAEYEKEWDDISC